MPPSSVFNDFELEHDFPTIGRRVMLLNARKLRPGDHAELLVLAMEDVTERRRAERLLPEIEAYAQNIVDTVREPLLMLDATLRVRSANRAFYQTFRVSPEQTENRLVYELGDGQWDIPALRALLEDVIPKRFVFDNLNFETGSTQLTPESVPTVDSLVVILKAYPAVAVRLEGHTDSTGDAAANQKLSLDRAIVVKEIMIKGGIPDERLGTDGYGQEKPVAPNETEEGRAKNRRTELVVEKR